MREYERLKDDCLHPPGGWLWRDPETLKVIVGVNLGNLVERAIEHRRVNGLDIPVDFRAKIEHNICRRLPDKYVRGRVRPVSGRVLGRHEVEVGTDELLRRWVKNGRRLVSMEVAKSRSDTCQHCDRNVKMGCLSCRGVDRYLLNWLGSDRRTGYEDLLGGCEFIGGYIMAGVHMLEDDLCNGVGAPNHCWRVKERLNGGEA